MSLLFCLFLVLRRPPGTAPTHRALPGPALAPLWSSLSSGCFVVFFLPERPTTHAADAVAPCCPPPRPTTLLPRARAWATCSLDRRQQRCPPPRRRARRRRADSSATLALQVATTALAATQVQAGRLYRKLNRGQLASGPVHRRAVQRSVRLASERRAAQGHGPRQGRHALAPRDGDAAGGHAGLQAARRPQVDGLRWRAWERRQVAPRRRVRLGFDRRERDRSSTPLPVNDRAPAAWPSSRGGPRGRARRTRTRDGCLI